jgi:hypothetical protein
VLNIIALFRILYVSTNCFFDRNITEPSQVVIGARAFSFAYTAVKFDTTIIAGRE